MLRALVKLLFLFKVSLQEKLVESPVQLLAASWQDNGKLTALPICMTALTLIFTSLCYG